MSNSCNNYTTTGASTCGCGCTAAVQNTSCGCSQNAVQGTSYQSTAAAQSTAADCTCRDAFATALRLLCSGDLAGLVDFSAFGFIGTNYLIGAYRTCPCSKTGSYDNLSDDLTGSFNRFTPCSCDLIDISGQVYDASPTADPTQLSALFTALSDSLSDVADVDSVVTALTNIADKLDPTSTSFSSDLQSAFIPLLGGCPCSQISVDEVSLCALCAIVFEAAGSTSAAQDANYQALKQILSQMLRPAAPACPPCTPPAPQPCTVAADCASSGLLASLDRCGMIHSLSLTAGPLMLIDVTLLGAVGDVLILANDDDNRIYFVCSDYVELVG